MSRVAAQGGLARMPVKLLGQLRERHPTSVPVRVLLGHASAGTVRASATAFDLLHATSFGRDPLKALCLEGDSPQIINWCKAGLYWHGQA